MQKAILISICNKTKGAKGAHLPQPYFMNKPRLQGRKADKALRELIGQGYIKRHPTAGEMTYKLDDRGFEVCSEIREQRKAFRIYDGVDD